MKKIILTIVLLSLVSCKKETNTIDTTTNKDSLSKKEQTSDTLASKQSAEVISFQTLACDNKGTYDTSKYSREEIEGTIKIYHNIYEMNLPSNPAFRLESLQENRNKKDELIAELDEKYNEYKSKLESSKTVNIPYWQKTKQQLLQSLTDTYQREKLILLAYSDPKVLLNSKFSAQCDQYAKALTGTDEELIPVWKKYVTENSKTNADPKGVLEKFEQHLNSPQKRDYAMIDLMIAWSNCANHTINQLQNDENMNKEFNKLFIKIDADCDEP